MALQELENEVMSMEIAEDEGEMWPQVMEKPWPDVLDPRKASKERRAKRRDDPDINRRRKTFQKITKSKEWVRARELVATYMRQRDVPRLVRFGMQDPPGDIRGWCCVALVKLGRLREAARLAAGPDGETPCSFATLRYVAHAMAKIGSKDIALHLAQLHWKQRISRKYFPGMDVARTMVECLALFLQATGEHQSRLLGAHAAQASLDIEKLMECKEDILSMTPNTRYWDLSPGFNQLIRWYGKARLIPQALRACEMMTELGIPKDEMTFRFLAKGMVQRHFMIKNASRMTQFPTDRPGHRPEVVFVGRVNSGKSSMINALLSVNNKEVKNVSSRRAWTRVMEFYEVNKERAGLPLFMLVDSPGLGFADLPNRVVRHFPQLVSDYFRHRQALRHVFHLIDARSKKLLPADKQILHFLASAQRVKVQYTIVITFIDSISRKKARNTADNIKKELAQYFDVDITFASSKTGRGVDQLWSKIWATVCDTPRGRKHRELAARELRDYEKNIMLATDEEANLASLLGIEEVGLDPLRGTMQDFDNVPEREESLAKSRSDVQKGEGGKLVKRVETGTDRKEEFDTWDKDLFDEARTFLDQMEERSEAEKDMDFEYFSDMPDEDDEFVPEAEFADEGPVDLGMEALLKRWKDQDEDHKTEEEGEKNSERSPRPPSEDSETPS